MIYNKFYELFYYGGKYIFSLNNLHFIEWSILADDNYFLFLGSREIHSDFGWYSPVSVNYFHYILECVQSLSVTHNDQSANNTRRSLETFWATLD